MKKRSLINEMLLLEIFLREKNRNKYMLKLLFSSFKSVFFLKLLEVLDLPFSHFKILFLKKTPYKCNQIFSR